MGSNLVIALNGLIALTELSEHLAADINAAAAKVRAAQSEGRDLTDAELGEIETARQAAVAEWNARNDASADRSGP